MSSPFHSSIKIKTAIKKYAATHTTELRVKKKKEVLLKPDTSPDMLLLLGKDSEKEQNEQTTHDKCIIY